MPVSPKKLFSSGVPSEQLAVSVGDRDGIREFVRQRFQAIESLVRLIEPVSAKTADLFPDRREFIQKTVEAVFRNANDFGFRISPDGSGPFPAEEKGQFTEKLSFVLNLLNLLGSFDDFEAA